jgi:hypothetical protein
MDGDGGGGWTPSPWCDVVISVSPLPLHLPFCGAWWSIYIEAPSRKSLGLTWQKQLIRAGPAHMAAR